MHLSSPPYVPHPNIIRVNQTKENDMGGACSTQEKYSQVLDGEIRDKETN
jgi:hypothetical protein